MSNYQYVSTMNKTGKSYLIGPFLSSFEAQKRADTLEYDYTVIDFPTRDLGKATRMYKASRLKDVGLDRAVEKVRHKDPMEKKVFGELDKRLEKLKSGLLDKTNIIKTKK